VGAKPQTKAPSNPKIFSGFTASSVEADPVRISPKILTRWTSDLASGSTIKTLCHPFASVVGTTIWRSGSSYTQVLNCIRRSYNGACGVLLETNPTHTSEVEAEKSSSKEKREEKKKKK
jgi:hypothetical protein